jgi:DegV family protein with EDD domain
MKYSLGDDFMSKIAVVTDSIACLPDDLKQKNNILVAPCYLIWDKVQYRDGVDMTAKEAYARLRTSSTVPTTASTIQGEFMKIYESLRGQVDGIVTVTVTGGMGASYNSALAAKEKVPGIPIEVIDSRNCYMAQGFAAVAAASTAQSGGNLKEATQAAQNIVSKVQTIFYVDTMEYLKKCGRVNLPSEVVDQWLKKKVMIVVKDGKLEPHPLQGNPADQLIEVMDKMVSNKDSLHVAVAHGDIDPTDLKNRVAQRYNPVELLTCMLTPVAGVHTGPGLMGISFYNE